MITVGTSYSNTLFDRAKLREAMGLLRPILAKLIDKHGELHMHIACTGKSGIAFCFALHAASDLAFDVLAVRKDGERAHGSSVEGGGNYVYQYIIVDDFVDSGDTVRNLKKRIDLYAQSQGEPSPTCLGFIEYNRLPGSPSARYAHERVGAIKNLAYYEHTIRP